MFGRVIQVSDFDETLHVRQRILERQVFRLFAFEDLLAVMKKAIKEGCDYKVGRKTYSGALSNRTRVILAVKLSPSWLILCGGIVGPDSCSALNWAGIKSVRRTHILQFKEDGHFPSYDSVILSPAILEKLTLHHALMKGLI